MLVKPIIELCRTRSGQSRKKYAGQRQLIVHVTKRAQDKHEYRLEDLH